MNRQLYFWTDGIGHRSRGFGLGILLLVAGLVLSLLAVPQSISAQERPIATNAAALSVFLDCPECDFDYIRTTIPWVSYVRDRREAQVHILVTTLATGSGGTEYTIVLLGSREFMGWTDTLHWTASSTNTSDEIRHGLAHMIQLGLIRYAATSAVGRTLDVVYQSLDTVGAPQHAGSSEDPWHHWFFSTGISGSFNDQESQSSGTFNSSFSANRTTAALKADIGLSSSYSQSTFTFPDNDSFSTFQRNYGMHAQLLHSMGAHWSAGEYMSVKTNTFLNERLAVRLAPAIEYDVFPYADATRRLLSIQSSVGLVHLRFTDTTLDNRLSLTQADLRTGVALNVTEPWGSMYADWETMAYFSTLRRQDMSFSPGVNLRVAEGLSLNLSADIQFTRNQQYLSRVGLTDAEILVQQRQLATSYNYSLNLGLNYSFGSQFNNVVFPRFNSNGVF